MKNKKISKPISVKINVLVKHPENDYYDYIDAMIADYSVQRYHTENGKINIIDAIALTNKNMDYIPQLLENGFGICRYDFNER